MPSRLELRLPLALRTELEGAAAERRWTLGMYVRVALEERLARDSAAERDERAESATE
jgi:hypothetical protein